MSRKMEDYTWGELVVTVLIVALAALVVGQAYGRAHPDKDHWQRRDATTDRVLVGIGAVRSHGAALVGEGPPGDVVAPVIVTTTTEPPTTVPPTSAPRTTAAPARSSRSEPAGRGLDSGLNWPALRQCENSGRYTSQPDDYYRGAYQFDYPTWESVGGSGDPAAASPSEQDARAQLLFDKSGIRPWPKCGVHLYDAA